MRFEGKVAIVTGGASGIGKATAEALIAEGGCVLVADVQDDRGAALAEKLGKSAAYQHCDVTREQDVASLIDRAVSIWGRLDLMFNNAGAVGELSPIVEMSDEGWMRGHDILLRSSMLGTKHAARVMRSQRSGCIISTSSAGALLTGLAPAAYAVFKRAVIQLAKVAAAELASHMIRVNSISPGYIATPMLWTGTEIEDEDKALAQIAEARRESQPLPVAGLGDDIAQAVIYLASESGRFITGHNLVVDGGLSLGKEHNAIADDLEMLENAIKRV